MRLVLTGESRAAPDLAALAAQAAPRAALPGEDEAHQIRALPLGQRVGKAFRLHRLHHCP